MSMDGTRNRRIGILWLAAAIFLTIADAREAFSLSPVDFRQMTIPATSLTVSMALDLATLSGAMGLLVRRSWARMNVLIISIIYLMYAVPFTILFFRYIHDQDTLHALAVLYLGTWLSIPFGVDCLAVFCMGALSLASLLLLWRKPQSA